MSRSGQDDPMPTPLQTMEPVADAIAAVLRPYAEVVLHDLKTELIAYIANPISRRTVGDSSLTDLTPVHLEKDSVIGPYSKTNPDGRPLKSITSVLRGETGEAFGLLCINIDVSMFESLGIIARDFLRLGVEEQRPSILFEKDWREEANDIIGRFLFANGTVADRLSSEERLELVGQLDARGLFSIRNAVPHIARVLGLSRATLYKVLKAARQGDSGSIQSDEIDAVDDTTS